MLADSHCHLDGLDLKNYNGDIHQAIAAARLKGVKYILSPGVSLESFPDVLKIVESDPDLFAALGVHPTEENAREPSLEELLTLGQNKKVVGIGETGLDFFYAKDEINRKRHERLFRLHIKAARELKKPLIIHSRDADQEMIKILKEEHAAEIGGVLHCFTGGMDMALEAINLGFYISFSGIITFKNAENLRVIAKTIPIEKMLIETDAPYLAPVPMRGKPNEPAYLLYTAEFMASLLSIPYESFASTTTENFLRCCQL
jgi:TatD DNase family protein